MTKVQLLLAMLIVAVLMSDVALCEGELRTWTSNKGDTIEAKLVNEVYGKVILQKEDGSKVTIPKGALSSVDRKYLEGEAMKKAESEKALAAEEAVEAAKAKLAEMGYKAGEQQEVNVPKTLKSSPVIAPKYLLYLPKEYGTTKEKWPLVLFLHGAGERGTDVKKVAVHGPPKHAKKKDLPYILIAPQCKKDSWWNPDEIMKLVKATEKSFDVDDKRIYITGLSMGGFGTWSTIMKNPKKFAAAIPICGGGSPQGASAIRKMPIWVFHGDADKTVIIDKSQVIVDALKDLGSDVKFTIYPGVGHDSWSKTYNNPEVFEWMLKQSL